MMKLIDIFKWRTPLPLPVMAGMMVIIFLSGNFSFAASFSASEEEIGRETDKQIIAQFKLYKDEKLQEYIRKVANKVLRKVSDPDFEYTFKLLDHEMVNAFALPGGYVYVTRGLLAALDSEAALAGVIGHEIGHVIGHHATKQTKQSLASTLLTLGALAASQDVRNNAAAWLTVTSTLSSQILLGYSREMEMESDRVGMVTAYEAGYDPDGIVQFLESLRMHERLSGQSYHGFYATHPDTIYRIIEAQGKAEILTARGGRIDGFRDRYLDAIEGLRYGKPKWRNKTQPPYTIHIHTVKEGETFRSIARETAGDEGLALEIAVLNAMDHNSPLEPGKRIKTIVPAIKMNKGLLKNHNPGEMGKKGKKKENKR